MAEWEITEAELIEWMEFYRGPRYHAVFSDPPYALISIAKRFGKENSAPAQEGQDGRYSRLSGGFMGQTWDGFDSLDEYQDWIAKWADIMIIGLLHPGAVCMFFGGTRTWHHLAVGLEHGGFEVYDTVMWLYGSGFPKRETSLKPAWEPILLCRAPRKGKTFDRLALDHSSGALNIDGARIEGKPETTRYDPNKHKHDGWRFTDTGEDTAKRAESASGRWPANLLLSHHEDCMKIGDFEVPGRTINRWQTGMKPFGDGAGDPYESEEFPPETVERWACVPECPIRQLDDQTGELVSGQVREGHLRNVPSPFLSQARGVQLTGFGDKGGPSRFFYCGKSSRKEKDKGLENFYWERIGDGFERVTYEEHKQLDKKKRAQGNIHPTVKPIDLCSYLATLMLPPKREDVTRRLLVPFSGSGSEMIGAIQAGWDYVNGIEMNPLYNEISRARLSANIGMF